MAMKFYSDVTKNFYNSAEDCEKAEVEFKEKVALAEAKKKELADAKAAEAKKVTEAFQKVREAQKEYDKLRNDFIKKYGTYHVSFTDPEEKTVFSIFEDFFRF